MRKNFLTFVVIILILVIIGFLPFSGKYHKALAAFDLGLLGGTIQSIRMCTCSGSQLLTIGPPRKGDFLFQPGVSILFSFRSIKIGSKVLGIASPVSINCMVYVGTGCVNQGQGKPIIMIGTSK